MNAQVCTYMYTGYVFALQWYALLPQYKVHSTYAATCKRNEEDIKVVT